QRAFGLPARQRPRLVRITVEQRRAEPLEEQTLARVDRGASRLEIRRHRDTQPRAPVQERRTRTRRALLEEHETPARALAQPGVNGDGPLGPHTWYLSHGGTRSQLSKDFRHEQVRSAA